MGGYGGRIHEIRTPDGAPPGAYFDPHGYMRDTVKLFEHIRSKVGNEIELLHDVHERLAPIEAVRLSKNLEPYRLFFLEDALAPESVDWFRIMRAQSATPIAMGELFTNSQEWLPLITERLIDFIRCHISTIGGITPAKKLAHLCEAFGIRTAWHGPGDVSPVDTVLRLVVHVDLHNLDLDIDLAHEQLVELLDVTGHLFDVANRVTHGDHAQFGVQLKFAVGRHQQGQSGFQGLPQVATYFTIDFG